MEDVRFSDLVGKTLTAIHDANTGSDRIVFVTDEGKEYAMYHSQDCCESVSVDDICGDINDLIGSPILKAEERGNSGREDMSDWPEDVPKPEYTPESYTWTFYELATVKGSVTIRWYGSSNGYYSESVYFATA